MTFGERLKMIRNQRGLTQQDLADKLGVPRPTMAGYETKGYEPSYDILTKLASTLNVTTDYLLGNIDNLDRDIHTIDKDIAAHLDGKDYSEEAKKSIISFIDFVDSQKNK